MSALGLPDPWPITAEDQARIVGNLLAILGDRKATARDRCLAARVLIAANGQNIQLDKLQLDLQVQEIKLARLGLAIQATDKPLEADLAALAREYLQQAGKAVSGAARETLEGSANTQQAGPRERLARAG
jgi:hypothetical protein